MQWLPYVLVLLLGFAAGLFGWYNFMLTTGLPAGTSLLLAMVGFSALAVAITLLIFKYLGKI